MTSPSLPTLMFYEVFSLHAHGLRQRGQNLHAPCQGACEFRYGARRSLQRRENTSENTSESYLSPRHEQAEAPLWKQSYVATSNFPKCFPKCSLDAEGFSVRHLEICTLLAKERADFDLVVSAHARGERTLRKTRASATSEK